MLKKSQIFIAAVGGSITLAIGAFYVIKDKTSHWLPKPLYCQVFPTVDKRHPGQLEVCINAIRVPFELDNGDVELDITFMRSPSERVQAEGAFWVADYVAGKKVDYTGEINWTKVRIYDKNLLVETEKHKISAWVDPLVPKDVHIPMWKWVKELSPALDRERLSFDGKLDRFIAKFIEVLGMVGTGIVTIYKVFKSTTG